MLYLDYSRKEGEWTPNAYGGRENLEAIRPARGDQRHGLQVDSLVWWSVAEESTALARRHPGQPTDGGLGFGFKWNMGWMHDSLTYMQTTRSVGPTTTTR